MGQKITIKVLDDLALLEVQQILKHGRANLPEWWVEAKKLDLGVSKCPSVRDVLNNSILFCAPSDIEISWDAQGVRILTAANIAGWGLEPVGATISINGDSEAFPYYKFSGGTVNFRIQLNAQLKAPGFNTVRAIWMPPGYFQKDSSTKRYTITPGSINFPPSWPISLLAMLSINLKESPHLPNNFTIKKGEVLGIYYFVDGVSKVEYEVDRAMTPHTRSRTLAGADYLIESTTYKKCPFRSSSLFNKFISWFRK
jgi:hypothetical protein